MMVDIDDIDVLNMAYAEGFDDGQKGDNYNPYDFDVKPDEWQYYEYGYIQGVMSGSYDDDGQPDEAQEWHDYDPDC
jgi:hypothetical protein